MCCADANLLLDWPFQESSRIVKTLTMLLHRAQHATKEMKNSSGPEGNMVRFNVGEWVWIAKGKAIKASKIRAL